MNFQREFIWNRKHPKIRNSSFYNTYENGSLKSVDIPNSKLVYNAPG